VPLLQGLGSTAELGPGALVTAGGLAGAAFWVCCYPADVIKSKIQTDNYFRPMYRWGAGLGKPSQAAAVGMRVSQCAGFALPFYAFLGGGACAVCLGNGATGIGETIGFLRGHSLGQADARWSYGASSHQADSYRHACRDTLDCGRKLFAASGWRGLWVGFGPCFARSIPANSAAFLTFEVVRKALS
jgi:hypothetical protein